MNWNQQILVNYNLIWSCHWKIEVDSYPSHIYQKNQTNGFSLGRTHYTENIVTKKHQ